MVMGRKEENQKLNFEFGKRVKELRESMNLSRKDFAELVDISDFFLVEIESGRRGVSNVTLCRIADVLATTTDYLLRGRRPSNTQGIAAILENIEEPFLPGAERILKEYINSISYIRAQERKGK